MSNFSLPDSSLPVNQSQTNVKTVAESAAEIMAERGYCPIAAMVELRQELALEEAKQHRLMFDIDKELLKYYRPSAQTSQVTIGAGGSAQIAILQPLKFTDDMRKPEDDPLMSEHHE